MMTAATAPSDGSRRPFGRGMLRAVVCGVAVTLAACSSPDGSAAGDDVDLAVEEVQELEPEVTTGAEGAEDGSAEQGPEESVAQDPPRPDLDLPEITLTTPAEGGGRWPELAWEPVASADRYAVTLYDPDGVAYWAWRGTEASVIAGGFAPPPPEGSGAAPRVRDGMTWDVVALDEAGELIAQSGVRPIAP